MNLPVIRRRLAPATLLCLGLAHSAVLAQPGLSPPWIVPEAEAAKPNPVFADKASILAGKSIYTDRCVLCHGATGKGDGPAAPTFARRPLDMADPTVQGQSDGALYWKVTQGRLPMLAFASILTDQQRWQVVNYMRTMGPTPPRFDAPDPARDAISGVIKSADALTRALAKSDASAVAEAAAPLKTAIARLQSTDSQQSPAAAQAAWKTDLAAVSTSAEPFAAPGADLSALRTQFRKFSGSLITLVTDFGHSEPAPVTIYVTTLAKPAESAAWLQAAAEPVNPFAPDSAPDTTIAQRRIAFRLKQIPGTQPRKP